MPSPWGRLLELSKCVQIPKTQLLKLCLDKIPLGIENRLVFHSYIHTAIRIGQKKVPENLTRPVLRVFAVAC
jgi:hypothetical protein